MEFLLFLSFRPLERNLILFNSTLTLSHSACTTTQSVWKALPKEGRGSRRVRASMLFEFSHLSGKNVWAGGSGNEGGGLHLHPQAHHCRWAKPGGRRHHPHLPPDGRPAHQGVPQRLILSAWGETRRAEQQQQQHLSGLSSASFTPNASALQGVGWWKYEFCYGKHVHQYHEVNMHWFIIEMYSWKWLRLPPQCV